MVLRGSSKHRTASRRFAVVFSAVFLAAWLVLETEAATFTPYASEASWQAAAAPTVLETFESYGVGVQIPNLPNLGVAFETLAGGGYPATYLHSENITPYGTIHLANFLNNSPDAGHQGNNIVLTVMSGYVITAMGYWNGDGQLATLTANVYDASNTLLGSVGAFKGTFAGFISDVPVHHVVFLGNTGDGWNHFDGLQTNASVVPLPAAFPLFASGLGLVAFMDWRRRRRTARKLL
jgi:hypothetical protein